MLLIRYLLPTVIVVRGVNVRAGTTPTREPSIHPFLIASSLRCQEQDGTVTRKAHPNSHLNVGDRCAIFVTTNPPAFAKIHDTL